MTTAPAEQPAAAPAAGAPEPASVSTSTGIPQDTGATEKAAWKDPWMAGLIAVGFVATIVLASLFFRRTAHS